MSKYEIPKIFDYFENDFRVAWDTIVKADIPEGPGHCNYMFGLMATVFIEWVGRLCSGNNTKLKKISQKLNEIDNRYFIEFPCTCCKNKSGFNYLVSRDGLTEMKISPHVFGLLYLNPPYDVAVSPDGKSQRLEAQFLRRYLGTFHTFGLMSQNFLYIIDSKSTFSVESRRRDAYHNHLHPLLSSIIHHS